MDTLTTSREILTTTIRFRDALAERIDALLAAFQDDGDGVPASANSLRGLLSFLEAHPALNYPSITLTPNGDFYASWKKARTHVFSIQFLDNGQVRFVVLRAEPAAQLSGLTTPTELMDIVAPLHVLDWASQ